MRTQHIGVAQQDNQEVIHSLMCLVRGKLGHYVAGLFLDASLEVFYSKTVGFVTSGALLCLDCFLAEGKEGVYFWATRFPKATSATLALLGASPS